MDAASPGRSRPERIGIMLWQSCYRAIRAVFDYVNRSGCREELTVLECLTRDDSQIEAAASRCSERAAWRASGMPDRSPTHRDRIIKLVAPIQRSYAQSGLQRCKQRCVDILYLVRCHDAATRHLHDRILRGRIDAESSRCRRRPHTCCRSISR